MAMNERYAMTLPEAVQFSGLGRTRLYSLAAEGRISFKKCGKRTLILAEDLKRLIESLPAAPIRCRSLTKPAADAA